MAAHCPDRLKAIARRLPTLSMPHCSPTSPKAGQRRRPAAPPDQLKGTVPNVQRLARPDSSTAPRYRVTRRGHPEPQATESLSRRPPTQHDEMKRGVVELCRATTTPSCRADQMLRTLVRREVDADRATTGITRRLSPKVIVAMTRLLQFDSYGGIDVLGSRVSATDSWRRRGAGRGQGGGHHPVRR